MPGNSVSWSRVKAEVVSYCSENIQVASAAYHCHVRVSCYCVTKQAHLHLYIVAPDFPYAPRHCRQACEQYRVSGMVIDLPFTTDFQFPIPDLLWLNREGHQADSTSQ